MQQNRNNNIHPWLSERSEELVFSGELIERIKVAVRDQLDISESETEACGEYYARMWNKNLAWDEIHDISDPVSQYKRTWTWGPYLWEQTTTGPFSVIDIESERPIDSKQMRGRMTIVEEMQLYDVNNKVSPALQLLINKIFAPYMPMVRLMHLKSWKHSRIVGTNAYHKAWRTVNACRIGAPKRVQDLLRIIYQYICCDSDHFSCHNMFQGIIFDFDDIGNINSHFISTWDTADFELSKINEIEKKELAEILFFFREYIIASCQDEIEILKNQSLTKKYFSYKKSEKERDKSIDFLNFMIHSSMNLSMGTIVLSGSKDFENSEVIAALEIDKILSSMY